MGPSPTTNDATFSAGDRDQVTRAIQRIGQIISDARRLIGDWGEAAGVIPVMIAFACLPIDYASALGGFIGRLVGPHLPASGRALRNLARAMPENGDAENRRILRAMWDNLGRAVA